MSTMHIFTHQQGHVELGFGLGMQLVEKLTFQFGWRYTTCDVANGFKVLVELA